MKKTGLLLQSGKRQTTLKHLCYNNGCTHSAADDRMRGEMTEEEKEPAERERKRSLSGTRQSLLSCVGQMHRVEVMNRDG